MKNGDVHDVCLALIKQISGSSELGRAPQAAALGWQLERRDVSVEQLSSWCAALLQQRGTSARRASLRRRWLGSPPLRAFLAEYRAIVSGAERPTGAPLAATAQPIRAARRDQRQGA